MGKFKFYEHFQELEGIKGIKAGDKTIEKLITNPETCLGHRKVGKRTYHIFHLNSTTFSVYYHGGGVDSMYSSDDLDTVLEYVNNLKEENC